MSEQEFVQTDSGAPRERRSAAELVKRLAAVLCGPSSQEYTVAQLGEAAKLLDRLFNSLSQVCVFGRELKYVRRGLACCAASARAHQLLEDSPAVCANTIALITTLVGMAVQPSNQRLLPDVGSEDDSTDEESEFDTEKQVAARAAKRARAWERQNKCKAKLEESVDAISAGCVVDYALGVAGGDAAAALEALVQELEVNLAGAVRMKEASLLVELAADCYADATIRLERSILLGKLEDATEFDPVGVQPMTAEDRAKGVRSLLASAGSEAGQQVLKVRAAAPPRRRKPADRRSRPLSPAHRTC